MESLRTAGLDRIESDGETGKVDAVAARTLDAAGAYYYTSDNDVRLYTDGNNKFRDLKEDLRNAERFIHLEYYIIRKDPLGTRSWTSWPRRRRQEWRCACWRMPSDTTLALA